MWIYFKPVLDDTISRTQKVVYHRLARGRILCGCKTALVNSTKKTAFSEKVNCVKLRWFEFKTKYFPDLRDELQLC